MAQKQLPLLVFTIVTSLGSIAFGGQSKVWQPAPGHKQIPIWPGWIPDAQATTKAESMALSKRLFGGRPLIGVDNVSKPTITVYSPKGINTGVAALVFPGGGYRSLAIDLEGTEVCDWLNSKGITAILLKYRVPFSGPYWDEKLRREMAPKAPMALEDAQRALGLIRLHAKQWHINPHKVGVIGFSAGGHMVAATSTHFKRRAYRPVDAADKESCRPDFAVAAYPGHLWGWTSNENPNFDLNPDIARHITSQTPPTFLVQAEDDNVDSINDSVVYYIGLKNAGVPVEMHLYAHGQHAFGLRKSKFPITEWPRLVETWLKTIGMTSK